MTIEQYLRGKIDFNLSDATLASVLLDRGIAAGTDATSVSIKQRELAYADLLMFLVRSSTSSSAEMESDGGWMHQKSSKNVTDRGALRSVAEAIYAKYDEPLAASAAGKIVFKTLY